MAELVWDEPLERTYQSGLDRGLFCDTVTGPALPWNGLVSVDEETKDTVTDVHFDGIAIHQTVVNGDYVATLETLTRPDFFIEYEGNYKIRPGVYLGDQAPRIFNFSWRSDVGNPVDGQDAYKRIHFLYNVIAVPKQRSADTTTKDVKPKTFQWELRSVPQDVTGHKPVSHLILDSRTADPAKFANVELLLYTDAFGPFIFDPNVWIGQLA